MTKQEVLNYLDNVLHPIVSPDNWNVYSELHDMIEELPSAESQMTVAEYRERMIQAFHSADCDSLIAVVVLPTEKEFQHLEWLLKKEYVPFLKKANRALGADLISRQAAIDALDEQLDYLQTLNKDENPTAESKWYGVNWARNTIADLPSTDPVRHGEVDWLCGHDWQ